MPQAIRVLVIDGEEIILKSIVKALEGAGGAEYAVMTANTAVEGLKLARANTFDLILIDLALPGMNGIEVLRRIKNTHPLVPVIVMSGYSFERALGDDATGSVDGLLSKPFTSGEIKSLISNILKT